MPWKTIITSIISLVVGFFIHEIMLPTERYSGGVDEDIDRVDQGRNTRVPTQSSSARLARIQKNGERLKQAEIFFSKQDGEAPPMVFMPAKLLEMLSTNRGINPLLDDLFSQSGEFEKFLNISEFERATLQRAWRETRNKIHKEEVSKLTSETLPDGSVKITVSDLSSQMAEIGSQFQKTLLEQLGENRANLFSSVRQIQSGFKRPEGDSTYMIEVESIGDGRWRYKVRLQGAAGSRSWVAERIPPSIQHLTDAASIRANLNAEELGVDE